MERNILYSLIAHCERSGYRVIGEYPTEEAAVYREIVLEAIKNFDFSEEEKISIQRGKYTVHLLISEFHYAALTFTPAETSSLSRIVSTCQIFLERLRCVYKELPILADFSQDFNTFSTIDLSAPLKTILDEFHWRDGDAIPKLQEELAEVRRVLMRGVQKLIDRGQRLEDLVQKTQSLEITVRHDFRLPHRTTSCKKKNVLVVAATSFAMIFSTLVFAFFMYMDFL